MGDPYGSTVIAGHVDTVERGIGFFFRLWNIQVGERVVSSAGHRRQAYKITSLRAGVAHGLGRRKMRFLTSRDRPGWC